MGYVTECNTIQAILPRDATLNLTINAWRITSSLKIIPENLLASFLRHAGWFPKKGLHLTSRRFPIEISTNSQNFI